MMTPTQPKTITAKEIEIKQKKLQDDSKEFATLVTESMKKHKVRQKVVMKYALDGMFASISINPYDWENPEKELPPDEKAYKAFSEELKAHMRKTSIRQRAIISGSQTAIEPKIDLFRFDWSKDDPTGKASEEVGPKVESKTKTKKNANKKSTTTKVKKASIQKQDPKEGKKD